MAIFQRELPPPIMGASKCRWGRQKSRLSGNSCLYRVLSTIRPPTAVIHTAAPDRHKLVTLIAGKRRRLLFTGDDDEVFMTRSLNVTPKTTEQRLIVRSGKSEDELTNDKRLRSRYCTVEANYWQTRSIARPLCNSRASCYDTWRNDWHRQENSDIRVRINAEIRIRIPDQVLA